MKQPLTLFTMLMSVSCAAVYGLNVSPIGNCPSCKKFDVSTFEPLKRVAMIKAEIMRRLGIHQQPTEKISEPKVKHLTAHQTQKQKKIDNHVVTDTHMQSDDTHELSELLSYSELPENFTDEHILQFKLSETSGQQLLVRSANLVVRVKCKQKSVKEQRSSSRERKKRKRRQRTVDLVIYSVNASGKPDVQLAAIKSKLRKTKWLRLNLPKEIVQQAVDSEEKKLHIYVKCLGCNKKTRLILAQKGRKRRKLSLGKPQPTRKLHKRRPILYLHTQIQSNRRGRRNAEEFPDHLRKSTTDCVCRRKPLELDLIEDNGWDWIIFPTRFKSGVCLHTCSNNMTSFEQKPNPRQVDRTLPTPRQDDRTFCMPVFHRSPLTFMYFDHNSDIRVTKLRNIIVTKCVPVP